MIPSYDGGGIAKGGDVALYVDGDAVGAGRVDRTMPFIFSADDGMDIGTDTGLKVTEDEPSVRFRGQIRWVQIDVGDLDEDHMITAEDRYHVAMVRQ